MGVIPSHVTLRQHMIFWAGAVALLMGFILLAGNVLLPFVLGLMIAYLLEPFMRFLERHKISRKVAALAIVASFFSAVTIIIVLLMPVLYRELVQLASALPHYVNKSYLFLEPYMFWLQDRYDGVDSEKVKTVIQDNIGKALNVSAGVVGGVVASGQAAFGTISVLVLTPITSYFMMKEWHGIIKWGDDLIPRGSYDTVKDLLAQMNRKLAGFIRGQITIAFFLAIIYAVALTIAGLKFGFLIGIMAGALSIIPLIGSTVGLVVSVLVAWFQTGEWSYVAMIAAIFLAGQIVEGNILTPKLLGDSVGLHPLWILFALLVGGGLFGIVGMFLAVPVAAVIGVLVSFALKQYRASPFYRDEQDDKTAKPKPKKTADKTTDKTR